MGDIEMAPRTASSSLRQSPRRLKIVMTKKCGWIACVAAVAGGLHGYTNGVAGGVSSMVPFLRKFYPEVVNQPKAMGLFCQNGSPRLQFYTSIHFITAVILEGSGVPAYCTRVIGRRPGMGAGGLLFGLGSLLQAAAASVGMLLCGRVIAGVGLSLASVSSLLYLSEIAPPQTRGRLLNMFETHLAAGILLSGFMNWGMHSLAFGWRLSLALPAAAGFGLAIALVFVPESPTSLLEKGEVRSGAKALRVLRHPHPIDEELNRLRCEASIARCCLRPWREMLKRRSFPTLLLSALCTLIQQLTGINFLVFYGAQLFISLGFSTTLALGIDVCINFFLFLGSLVTVALVDRLGRRSLLISGSIVSSICMLAIALLLTLTTSAAWLPWAVLVPALIFSLAYGWSWGPMGWTYPAEIQAMQTRSVGLSITTFFNVFLSAITAQAILPTSCALRQGLFYFFSSVCAAAAVVVYYVFPEPCGKVDAQHLFEMRPWITKPLQDIEDD